jgi:cell division protease FtsH
MSKATGQKILLALVALLFFVFLAGIFGHGARRTRKATTYSALITRAERDPGSIHEVVFKPGNNRVEATLADGTTVSAHYPSDQSQVLFQELLQKQNVTFDSSGTKGSSALGAILSALLPLLLLVGLWFLTRRRAHGGLGDGLKGFSSAPAKRLAPNSQRIRFADVAGAEEAVEELREVVSFLKRPRTFRALGARIPSGVLLYGPPGTGKTLLARAVAGEAGVPFFSMSGSDFVEMFAGVGASRVRDLFAQAREAAPCIVFVDEIDAVGGRRGGGFGSAHDEREQTLNQLLVEMDGFEPNDEVILIAATNRPDILDPALLRPGRFDRRVGVGSPDRAGRREILAIHAKGKLLAPASDLDTLAAGTPGLCGADLANLLNEAALLAARSGKALIGQAELEEGLMRVIAGPEKKTRLLSEREREITAYHELGHALVGHYLTHTDPVHKVTIVSRGQALGLTLSLPGEDKYLTTRSALEDRLATTLGGRAAEELVFEEITSGAANDLQDVTETAKRMVTQLGMSDKIGPRVVGDREGNLAREIDDEIGRLIDDAYRTATNVLRGHLDQLHTLATILIEHETIDRQQFERLLAGEAPDKVFPESVPPPRPLGDPQANAGSTLRPQPFPVPGALSARAD